MKPWSEQDIKLLTKMCTEGCTKVQASNALGRSVKAVQQKAALLGLGFIRQSGWTQNDVATLRELALQGKDVEHIANAMHRTVSSIRTKASRVGVVIQSGDPELGMQNRPWSVEDRNTLQEMWADDSVRMITISKALKRNIKACQSQASQMGLGPRREAASELTVKDIAEEMGVTESCVRRWFQKGLKRVRKRMGYAKYLVRQEDLLEFLSEHKLEYDASKISKLLFYEEPAWLIEKRKQDAERPIRHRDEWSNEEDKQLRNLHDWGYSTEEIAAKLNRTVGSIEMRKTVLFLQRNNKWSEADIKVLQSCDDIDKLCQLFPNRTRKAIIKKKWKLRGGGK